MKQLSKDLVFIALCVVGIVLLSSCATVKPPPLADGRWQTHNAVKDQTCLESILEIARRTPNLSDEHLEDAKRLYWLCLQYEEVAI